MGLVRTGRGIGRAARLLGPLGLIGLAAAMGPACSTADDTGDDPYQVASFDEDVDPEELAAYEGKADGDPCANHPGGTLTGDDLLLIVNKEEQRQLRSDWSPPDLLTIDDGSMMPGRNGQARVAAVLAGYELAAAAKLEAGLDLVVRSAYRSYYTQCLTFNYKVDTAGYEHAARFSARPGRSEHQLGTALDFTSDSLGYALTQTMGETAEGIWLAANAHRFGFGLSYPPAREDVTGYAYEPWHWRYIGREAALEMAAHGLALVDYLFACEAGDPALSCPRELPPALEPNVGFIGGRCSVQGDCASLGTEARCLGPAEGYPAGHCTIPCTLPCPDRDGPNATTFCVDRPLDAAPGSCHSRCDTSLFPGSGCREGYDCLPASRPSNAGTAMACVPQ